MRSMKLNRQRFVLLGCLCALMLSATANTPITKNEIPNFQQVNERFYRGGQPKPGSLKRLAEMGVKTVINLRGEDGDISVAEEKEAREAGLKYYSFPLSQLNRPSEEQMKRIMTIINSAEHQPVFVHCRRGSDRTGTVVGTYRITVDKWTAKQAQAEADKYGMRWWEFGMKDYLRDLEKEQNKVVAAR